MDFVRRFLFENLDIRGALVSLGNAWHEMQAGRDDPPAVAALLGELAAVTALIAGNLKTPGRLTFQLQGHGLVSLLLADCDEQLRLRGTARYRDTVPPASTFAELLGDGQLILTLQTSSGDPWQSIVPLVGNSLAAVFEHYLAQSEQQPTIFMLSASEDFAGGLFLQKLPARRRKGTRHAQESGPHRDRGRPCRTGGIAHRGRHLSPPLPLRPGNRRPAVRLIPRNNDGVPKDPAGFSLVTRLKQPRHRP